MGENIQVFEAVARTQREPLGQAENLLLGPRAHVHWFLSRCWSPVATLGKHKGLQQEGGENSPISYFLSGRIYCLQLYHPLQGLFLAVEEFVVNKTGRKGSVHTVDMHSAQQ